MSESVSAIIVRRLAAQEWRLYRALRLRALRDSPDSFGSTLAREEEFTDEVWKDRLDAAAASDTDFPMIAEHAEQPAGMAWARIDAEDREVAALYQVWVDPAHRRRGVGRLMIDEALDWARDAGARQMVLNVVHDVRSAVEFYQRLGFVDFGTPRPLRPGSALLKQTMRRIL